MISHIYIHGGLANQMFQYAATFAHSRKMGVDLFYPIKPILPDSNACPNLYDVFKLSASRTGVHGPVYNQRSAGFHYTPIPEQKDLTLDGYFQSEKYFSDYEEEIRKEFIFRNPVKLYEEECVSIHVRRGDYLKYPNHHPICSMDYYKEAMNEFKEKKFIVFSDDKKWCLENFNLERCSVSLAECASEELQLMSQCKGGHIIANSSFGWWGAWLGDPQKNKKVIAPKDWFGVHYNNWDTSDLYLPHWKLL